MIKYLFMIVFFITSPAALSLSCAITTIQEKIRTASIIFIGKVDRVISSKEINNSNPWDAERKIVARLKVIRTIKGSTRESELVDFSYRVVVGQKYLIFDNSAFSSMCSLSPSKRLEDAGTLLKILGVK